MQDNNNVKLIKVALAIIVSNQLERNFYTSIL